MTFFEPPEPPEADSHPPPVWLGPPRNMLPGVTPVELVIARTENTVVAVHGIRAYPSGFDFTLSLRLRTLSRREKWRLSHSLHPYFAEEQLRTDDLRFGVQFADGRKAFTSDRKPVTDPQQEPEGLVILQHGGVGGGRWWDLEQWVWPLPTPDPLTFVCKWAPRQIPETQVEVDAQPILEAARRAVLLWPDNDDGDDYVEGWATFRGG